MLHVMVTEKTSHLDNPINATDNQIMMATISKVIEAIYNWVIIFRQYEFSRTSRPVTTNLKKYGP